jgi:hypothetical protein
MPGITSRHAAHLRTKFGEPLQNVWGANIGFDFAETADADAAGPAPADVSLDGGSIPAGDAIPDGGCRQGSSRDFNGTLVDLSDYSGFTFWAMASSSGRQSIRVQINNAHTDPRGRECTPSDDPSNEKYCYNGYGKAILLTSTFTQYRVDFSELRQDPGWGYDPDLESFNPASGAFSMNFEVPLPGCVTDEIAKCAGGSAPVAFDVWIDDLYFVKRRQP